MEKKKIETFIKKYSLDGTIESVVWMNDNNDLHTRAMTSDKKLFSSVRFDGGASNFIDKGQELVILATDKLEKMISVLGDNVSLTLDVDEKDKTAWGISDPGEFFSRVKDRTFVHLDKPKNPKDGEEHKDEKPSEYKVENIEEIFPPDTINGKHGMAIVARRVEENIKNL